MAQTTCSLPDCERPKIAKSFCDLHYRRWRRTGSTEPERKDAPEPVGDDGLRKCSTCGERLPLRRFAIDRRLSSGRRAKCMSCTEVTRRQRHKVNAAAVRERARLYRLANPDRAKVWARRNYEKNRDAAIQAAVDQVHRRRALISKRAPDTGISHESLRRRDGDGCPYCGITMSFTTHQRGVYVPDRATIEHVIPVSRGGSHTWDNVCLACWRCNLRKNRRMADEWEGAVPRSGQ